MPQIIINPIEGGENWIIVEKSLDWAFGFKKMFFYLDSCHFKVSVEVDHDDDDHYSYTKIDHF